MLRTHSIATMLFLILCLVFKYDITLPTFPLSILLLLLVPADKEAECRYQYSNLAMQNTVITRRGPTYHHPGNIPNKCDNSEGHPSEESSDNTLHHLSL